MERALLIAFRERVLAGIREQLARESASAETRRAEVVPIVFSAIARARSEGRCGRAWLFGSFAWGSPQERSDVDVLVEGCAEPDSLAGEIWRVADRPVHVVEIERAAPSLVERVLSEGHPL